MRIGRLCSRGSKSSASRRSRWSTSRCSPSSSPQSLRERLPGAHTKNLFLTDKDGRAALVVAKDDTPRRSEDGGEALRARPSQLRQARAPVRAARRDPGLGHAVRPDQRSGGARHRGGRCRPPRLRRGQLPSAGEYRHDQARHRRLPPLHPRLRSPTAHSAPLLTVARGVAKPPFAAHLPGKIGRTGRLGLAACHV